MAQEASQTSVASSSVSTNSWWEIHGSSLSTWNTINQWPRSNHHSNSSSCDEDLSISNTNHSGLSMNSSANFSAAPMENHLWNQVLLNAAAGSGRDMRTHQHDDRENFLEVLNSKTLTTDQMFNPSASDNLKKLDSSFGFANPQSLNRFEKLQPNNFNEEADQRLPKNLSDLVSNWSIAPPNPQLDHHVAPSSCNFPITPMAQYSSSSITPIKHEVLNSPSYPSSETARERSASYIPYYDRDTKGESQHLNSSAVGYSDKFCAGTTELNPWSNTRSLSDLISFTGCLNKPPMELRSSRSYLKGLDSSDSRVQGHDNSSTRGNGRITATTEGKKKRTDDNSETLLKKSKHENSTASCLTLQAPKVKMADKITALQQLVSPFGKTDTASVLFETINCIRILQEQVQLLSDPYMKSSSSKDHSSWGEMERKEKAEAELDLRSKGLCLVPVSCIPQVHRENGGPDYWMPTYRSCLYR